MGWGPATLNTPLSLRECRTDGACDIRLMHELVQGVEPENDRNAGPRETLPAFRVHLARRVASA